MEIIKKNVVSIICGVIILAAIISWFWPIGGMEKGFTDAMGKRAAVHATLTQTLTKQRTWPVVELDANAEAVHLQKFPGEKVLVAGEHVAEELSKVSKAMEASAVKMNQHQVLVPDVLPKTTDAGPILRFRDKYREMILKTLPTEYLLGTTPPTDEEIDKAMDKLWQEKYVQKFIYVSGKAVNDTKVSEEFTAEVAGMPKRIRDERANKYQCYVDEGAISISDVMAADGRAPSLGEVWYAQSSLWVQEDLARSIARVNAGSISVGKAAVKHVKFLQVSPTLGQYLRAGMSGNGAMATAAPLADGAAAAAADPNAPLPKDYSVSPTGRVCNPKYDVVQFNLKLVVEASKIPMLLQEISREKTFFSQQFGVDPAPSTFATITKLDIAAVDNALASESGFQYGDRPVVELTLQGESLFLRAWTVPLMPPSVKLDLGIDPAAVDPSKAAANAG